MTIRHPRSLGTLNPLLAAGTPRREGAVAPQRGEGSPPIRQERTRENSTFSPNEPTYT
jgi:hypothetical protein